MKMIEAKPTQYKGVQFRSLLEARWARFFDVLDIKWEYEPKKIELPSGDVYIPDFWLPHTIEEMADDGWGFWAEMKPIHQDDNDRQVSKLLQIAQLTLHNVLLFIGYPKPDEYEIIKYSVGNEPDSTNYGIVYNIATGLKFKSDGYGSCHLENNNGFGSFPYGYGSLYEAYGKAWEFKSERER